jgi:hypothetical protein
MNLALIFLIVAALFGYTAEKNLDDNPDLGIPTPYLGDHLFRLSSNQTYSCHFCL